MIGTNCHPPFGTIIFHTSKGRHFNLHARVKGSITNHVEVFIWETSWCNIWWKLKTEEKKDYIALTLFYQTLPDHLGTSLSNPSNFYQKWAGGVKSSWQLLVRSLACIDVIFFTIYCQKLCKNFILRYPVNIFYIFYAIFINWWYSGNPCWLWNQGSCVQIQLTPFFHIEKCWCQWDWTQSHLCLSLDYWDRIVDAKKQKKASICLMVGYESPLSHKRF